MKLQINNSAPPFTEEKLNLAKNHSSEHIRKLAKYVEEAKTTKKIPNILPHNQYINGVQAQCASLSKEDRAVAFHVIWYIKELTLGRLHE